MGAFEIGGGAGRVCFEERPSRLGQEARIVRFCGEGLGCGEVARSARGFKALPALFANDARLGKAHACVIALGEGGEGARSAKTIRIESAEGAISERGSGVRVGAGRQCTDVEGVDVPLNAEAFNRIGAGPEVEGRVAARRRRGWQQGDRGGPVPGRQGVADLLVALTGAQVGFQLCGRRPGRIGRLQRAQDFLRGVPVAGRAEVPDGLDEGRGGFRDRLRCGRNLLRARRARNADREDAFGLSGTRGLGSRQRRRGGERDTGTGQGRAQEAQAAHHLSLMRLRM